MSAFSREVRRPARRIDFRKSEVPPCYASPKRLGRSPMPARPLALLAFLAGASLLFAEEDTLPKPKLIAPRSGADKETAAKKYGATKETEAAVELGLDWLARHAEP